MTRSTRRVYSLMAVMLVLTQCCCCIGIPVARRTASTLPAATLSTTSTGEVAAAYFYRLPTEVADYVSQNLRALIQEAR